MWSIVQALSLKETLDKSWYCSGFEIILHDKYLEGSSALLLSKGQASAPELELKHTLSEELRSGINTRTQREKPLSLPTPPHRGTPKRSQLFPSKKKKKHFKKRETKM